MCWWSDGGLITYCRKMTWHDSTGVSERKWLYIVTLVELITCRAWTSYYRSSRAVSGIQFITGWMDWNTAYSRGVNRGSLPPSFSSRWFSVLYKKFELMLTGRAKAYSSSCPQSVTHCSTNQARRRVTSFQPKRVINYATPPTPVPWRHLVNDIDLCHSA